MPYSTKSTFGKPLHNHGIPASLQMLTDMGKLQGGFVLGDERVSVREGQILGA